MFSKLFGELIDIIEWIETPDEVLVYRFERYNNEIKHGAKLIVRPGQMAVFVNQGTVADTFQPGTYTLTTANLPILSTLQGWKYGFESPFKAEVYFFSTKIFSNLKWGTATPVIKRDPELGVVRLRGRGQFSVQLTGTPTKFLTDFVGSRQTFSVQDAFDYLRSTVVMAFGDLVATETLGLLDLATQYQEHSIQLRTTVEQLLGNLGYSVPMLTIEAITVPAEVEALIDKRSGMNVVGQNNFVAFQGGLSITENPGGNSIANDAIGLGLGLNMANQIIAQSNQATQAAPQGPRPPQLPEEVKYFWADGRTQRGPMDLEQLAALIKDNTITGKTLVWHNGMEKWEPARTVPALQELLAPGPPPLPAD